MNLHPVISSNIAAIGYDPQASRLVVKFKSGAKYAYDSVPAEIHKRLIAAERIGTYFHQNVRDKFKATKLESAVNPLAAPPSSPSDPQSRQA